MVYLSSVENACSNHKNQLDINAQIPIATIVQYPLLALYAIVTFMPEL